MNFKLYKLEGDLSINQIENNVIDHEILDRLNQIEEEIIKEYLKKQTGVVGVKKLGNEIRYNEVISDNFSSVSNRKTIEKFTENKRSFLKLFVDLWKRVDIDDIYLYILDSNFGRKSNMVDNSFITISDMKNQLKEFSNYFKPIKPGPNILILEILGFSEYKLFKKEGGYSVIIKK
jgi:hypothetical protein